MRCNRGEWWPDPATQHSARHHIGEADNPALDSITRSLVTAQAVVELRDTVFSGLPISRAFVITSKKQEHLGRSGASAITPDHAFELSTDAWAVRLAALEEEIRNHNPNAELYRRAAYCALHLQEFEKALGYDTNATNLDANLVMAWVGRVVAASFLMRHREVDRSFKALSRIAEAHSVAYLEASFYYAKSLVLRGQIETAMRHFAAVAKKLASTREPYLANIQQQAKGAIDAYGQPRRNR